MSEEKEQIIWFELKGKYAHFRKPSNLTTKQSYDVPPRTAITGMLAGGLGYSPDSYYDLFNPEVTQIGVEVIGDISKRSISKNYKNTQDNEFKSKRLPNGEKLRMISPKTYSEKETNYQQETLEYIRQPHYIIYIKTEVDELFEQLKSLAINSKWIYSPYFGSNECFADHIDGGMIEVEKQEKSDITVDTVVPKTVIDAIHSTDVFREKIVANFQTDEDGRKPTDYITYYYLKSTDNLSITSQRIYKLKNNKNIVLY